MANSQTTSWLFRSARRSYASPVAKDEKTAGRVRQELERLGVDHATPDGIRVRASLTYGFVRLATSSVPAEELEVDAQQVLGAWHSLTDRAGRAAAIKAAGLPVHQSRRSR
jgi:inactivated superfamily I helicase